jgi:hypothetical protein
MVFFHSFSYVYQRVAAKESQNMNLKSGWTVATDLDCCFFDSIYEQSFPETTIWDGISEGSQRALQFEVGLSTNPAIDEPTIKQCKPDCKST